MPSRGSAGHVRSTYLLSFRSVLFPTKTIMTSCPLSFLTSSTHLLVFWKDTLPGNRVREIR